MLEVILAVRSLQLHDRVDGPTDLLRDVLSFERVEEGDVGEKTVEDLAKEVAENPIEKFERDFIEWKNELLEVYARNSKVISDTAFNRYVPVEACRAYYDFSGKTSQPVGTEKKSKQMNFNEVAKYMRNQQLKGSWMCGLSKMETPEEKARYEAWKIMTPGSSILSYMAFETGMAFGPMTEIDTNVYSNGTSLQSFHSLEGA